MRIMLGMIYTAPKAEEYLKKGLNLSSMEMRAAVVEQRLIGVPIGQRPERTLGMRFHRLKKTGHLRRPYTALSHVIVAGCRQGQASQVLYSSARRIECRYASAVLPSPREVAAATT